MTKQQIRSGIVFGTCLILYHLVVFLIPFTRNMVFWLSDAVYALDAAVFEGDTDAAVKALCRRASFLLAERNRLCKLNKN